MVKEIATEVEYKSAIEKGAVVVDFHAVWCGPCVAIAPLVTKQEEKYGGKVKFFKVDVDKLPGVAKSSNVSAMPTFLMFLNGQLKHTVVGADPSKITSAISSLAAEAESGAAASTA